MRWLYGLAGLTGMPSLVYPKQRILLLCSHLFFSAALPLAVSPEWPMRPVSTVATGVNESTVIIQLPQLEGGASQQYPNYELQYREVGTVDWTTLTAIPGSESSVELDAVFPDGQYEVRVRGSTLLGLQQTVFTPKALFYTRGQGNCENVTLVLIIYTSIEYTLVLIIH